MDKKVLTGSTNKEVDNRNDFFRKMKECPIPEFEFLENLGLFISRQNMSRILFMHELYKQIIDVHGIVIEFGVRWGQNLCLFESFRGIYEPYNYNRQIVGFDTFEGFKSVDELDGKNEIMKDGSYDVTENYEKYLEEILDYHESESPISHKKKYELVKGDATETIHKYLKINPQTIISMAYFDFDIYKPTKECLQAILPHLTKGSVIGFDELNFKPFQGETIALKEILGLDKYKIRRSPLSPLQSYIIIE